MEAGVGIEPASTALQAGPPYSPQHSTATISVAYSTDNKRQYWGFSRAVWQTCDK